MFIGKNNTQHSNKLLGQNPELLLLKLTVCIYLPPGFKKKAITLQAWTGFEGSRSVRLPEFKTIGTGRW